MSTLSPSNHPKGGRINLPRIGIQTQAILWGLVALLLALPLMGGIIWYAANAHAYKEAEDQVNSGMTALEREISDAGQNLDSTARWLVSEKTFADSVSAQDRLALNRLLQPLVRLRGVDQILVTDDEGNMLTFLDQRTTPSAPNQPVNLPFIQSALDGREVSSMDLDDQNNLYQRFFAPVYRTKDEPPIGVLAVSASIDSTFLRNAARRQPVQYALISQNRFVKTTLTDKFGKAWEGNFTPQTWSEPFLFFRPTFLSLIGTDQGNFLFRFKPLATPNNSALELIGTGVSTDLLEQGRSFLLRTMGLLLLVGILDVGLIGWIFGRNLVSPLRALDSSVGQMIKGDVDTRIVLRRGDEIGDLSWQLDALRKEIQAKLRTLNHALELDVAVIRSMSQPVVITNGEHTVAFANPAAEALLHSNGNDPVGKPWLHFFVLSEERVESSPFWQSDTVVGDGNREMVVRGRFPLRIRPDVVLEVRSTQLRVRGAPEGYVHILNDASEVEQFAREKDQFLLNLAHELQGPLASWRSSVELLLEDFPNLSPRELGVMLKGLERNTTRFESLVEVLIDIGKLEAGRFRIRPSAVRVNQMVQDALPQIDSLLQAKGQRVELTLECPPNCMVLADRQRIIQVLVNFLRNASKYGPEDQPICVSTYRQGRYVYIEVTDRGEGITPEEQQHVFDRFFRGKRVEEEGAGIGIGLALCKGIVEAHGGRVGVRSQIGQGSTFWLGLSELSPLASDN